MDSDTSKHGNTEHATNRRQKTLHDLLLTNIAGLSGADLSHGIGSPEAKDEYRDFTRDIEAIPATERLKRVLDEQLWDRRQKPR